MRKFLFFILCIVMVLSAAATGYTSDTDVDISKSEVSIIMQIDNPIMTVNGVEAEIDPGEGTIPIIKEGRTLVPIRAIIESIGGEVAWNAETSTATIKCNDDIIVLTVGSITAYINGDEGILDVAPIVLNGRILMPIRFIAEGFGLDTVWNQDDRTITITNNRVITETDDEELSEETAIQDAGETDLKESEGNILIVYFSRTGNTKSVAETIKYNVGGDIFEIVTVEPYPDDYDEVLEQVRKEQSEGYKPELMSGIEDMDKYETIFVGYPIWFGQLPPPVTTFLTEYDFSGKTIVPFCTHQGSGLGRSESEIKELCLNADVLDGLAINGGNSNNSQSAVEEWLENSDLLSNEAVQ